MWLFKTSNGSFDKERFKLEISKSTEISKKVVIMLNIMI